MPLRKKDNLIESATEGTAAVATAATAEEKQESSFSFVCVLRGNSHLSSSLSFIDIEEKGAAFHDTSNETSSLFLAPFARKS